MRRDELRKEYWDLLQQYYRDNNCYIDDTCWGKNHKNNEKELFNYCNQLSVRVLGKKFRIEDRPM